MSVLPDKLLFETCRVSCPGLRVPYLPGHNSFTGILQANPVRPFSVPRSIMSVMDSIGRSLKVTSGWLFCPRTVDLQIVAYVFHILSLTSR